MTAPAFLASATRSSDMSPNSDDTAVVWNGHQDSGSGGPGLDGTLRLVLTLQILKPRSRTSTTREVVMVSWVGCRNSRCIPRRDESNLTLPMEGGAWHRRYGWQVYENQAGAGRSTHRVA